jgi:hypothetical protein
VAYGLLTAPAMRIIQFCLFLGLFGCAPTADQICDGVSLGTPIANVFEARPAGNDSWCATHPARDVQGPIADARCCLRSTSAACNTDCSMQAGASLFSVGPFVEQHSDSAQCCVIVRDGKVAARFVGYD